MSGGSMNYFYHEVNRIAEQLDCKSSAIRREFAKHLNKVAEALHDIEWVDSSDYGTGEEIPAIKRVLGKIADTFCEECKGEKVVVCPKCKGTGKS